MNIISIEASSNICSVSSFKDNQLVNLIETTEPRSHSRNLPIMIRQIIQDFTTKDKITAFSVSIGPGSFTSLRISLSIVKGIAFTLKNNIIPVPTFDYLNFQISNQDIHYIALSSFKNKCFVQKFDADKSLGRPYLELIDNLRNVKENIYADFQNSQNGIKCIKIIPNSVFLGRYAIKNSKKLLKKYNDQINLIYLSNVKYEKNVSKSK